MSNRNSVWHTTSLAILLLLPSVCFSASVELIQNGSFSSGSTNWTTQGSDVWIGTNLSNYRTSPGYAALGVSSTGISKNNADGAFYQTVTVPENATRLTFTFWYFITTQESTTASAFDHLSVTVRKSNGDLLATAAELTNANYTSGYVQKTFDLTDYISEKTLRIRFGANSNGSQPTVFRIDDVSVVAEVATAAQSPPTAPTSLSPGTNSQSGQEVTGAPTLSWAEVTGATAYQLYLYNFDKGEIIENQVKIDDTSYTPSGLIPGDLYLWNVTACNTAGCGAYASFRYFKIKRTTSSADVPPILGLGNGGVSRPGILFGTTTPELILISQSKNYTYNIRIFDFTANVYVVEQMNYAYNNTYVRFTAPPLGTGREYKWDAEACNDKGCSGYSEPRYFFIQGTVVNTTSTLSVPNPTEPGFSTAPGSIQSPTDLKVLLKWEGVSNAQYYNIKLGYFDPRTGSYGDHFNITSVETEKLYELAADEQYRWQVQACNGTTCSAYSEPLYFSVSSSDSMGNSGTGTNTPKLSDFEYELDIRVNDQEGPIKLVQGENTLVSLSFDAYEPIEGDWWVVAKTPFPAPEDYYFFDGTDWKRTETVFQQGPLVSIPSREVLSTQLPVGTYTFYFGLDLLKNRVLDIVNDLFDFDSVDVDVINPDTRFKLPLPGGYFWKVTTEVGGTACNDPVDEAHTDKNIGGTGTYYFIDFSTFSSKSNFQIDKDVPALAVADGYIVDSGHTTDRGNYVIIDHDEDKNINTGITSWYLHLRDNPTIKGRVEQGDQIGVVGKTGTEVEHLHFGFKYYGRSLSTDPVLSYLKMDGRFLQDYKSCNQNIVKLPGYESTNRVIPW